MDERPPERTSWLEQIFRRSLPMERETSMFVLVSALDVFMTYLVLRFSADERTTNVFYESNPLADFILHRWGIPGMVYFKFALVAFVTVSAQIIATKRPHTARLILLGGSVVVAGVVIYSLALLLRNVGLF